MATIVAQTIVVAMNRPVSSKFPNTDSSRNAYCLRAARILILSPPMHPLLGTKNCLFCCSFSRPSCGTTFLPCAGEGDDSNTEGDPFLCGVEVLALPYQVGLLTVASIFSVGCVCFELCTFTDGHE